MNHPCCPRCRLRFAPAAAAHLVACPECGDPPQPLSGEGRLGFRLFELDDVPFTLPEAIAVALALPDPEGGRS